MTDKEFLDLCEHVLETIEDTLDESGASVETSRAGLVLELEFDDASKVIVNGNQHLREIWVAARSGGFHFRREGDRWVDTRSGENLYESLARLLTEQAGSPVAFRN